MPFYGDAQAGSRAAGHVHALYGPYQRLRAGASAFAARTRAPAAGAHAFRAPRSLTVRPSFNLSDG